MAPLQHELEKGVYGGQEGIKGAQVGLFRHHCIPLAIMKIFHFGFIVIIPSKVATFFFNNDLHCNMNTFINVPSGSAA